MYEELVMRLRDGEAWENCDFDFIYGWAHDAADAAVLAIGVIAVYVGLI